MCEKEQIDDAFQTQETFVTLYEVSSIDIRTGFGKAFVVLIIAISGTLLYESFFIDSTGAEYKPKPNQPCNGTPIRVDYPYHGGMISPHACQPQCGTNQQRYVLYANGKATQCQTLPGCLDWGEDQGVTCIPSI